VLASPSVWGHTSPALRQVEDQTQERHRAAAAHQQQLQRITDPVQRSGDGH
jgi:hypothetical protein